MKVASRPIDATIAVDRLTSPNDLTVLAQFEHQLDGTHPYVRFVQVGASCSPLGLLPEDAAIERCVTTDTSVTVLATVDGATIHVASQPTQTNIRVTASSADQAEQLAEHLRAGAPPPPVGTVAVRVWHHNNTKPAARMDRNIDAPHWDQIATNYPQAVRRSLDAIIALEAGPRTGKLVLWHGPPGTGKTTVLRALMRSWSIWCQAQYISDPEQFFSEPAYMAQVLTTAPAARVGPTLTRAGRPEAICRLIIAEDTDEYLRSTARRDAGAALGRLLNLADGILGQGMNVIVLLTTNEATSRLHPALIRPGRCLAEVEFSTFTASEGSKWLGETADRCMTLAELLEQRGDITSLGTTRHTADTPGQYL